MNMAHSLVAERYSDVMSLLYDENGLEFSSDSW